LTDTLVKIAQILRTQRLLLRDLVLSDLDEIHAYASDPLVTRFTAFGPNTLADTRAFLERSIVASAALPRRSYTFAVVEHGSGSLIGSCGMEQSDLTGRQYIFGYCLNRQWWSSGFGTEAAGALVQFGFEHLRAHRLWAHVFLGNVASEKILQKLGFRREGLALQSLFLRDAWHDILTFGQLQAEWVARAGDS
jgi:RimJ/RimL family protein N-acetyltransferase